MIGHRTRRLSLLIALGTAVLLGRLAWVQVLEHRLWADEAARLVHSGQVVPYSRGSIRDSEGVELARDVEAYHLTVAYRPFRREHPIGQVAHARTALELRAVTLREASRNLERWGAELVGLTPAESRTFAEGGGLSTDSLEVAPTSSPADQDRAGRAGDLAYYIRGLLGASRAEWRELRARAKQRPAASYLQLFAELRGRDADEIEHSLTQRWSAARDQLEYLAAKIELVDGQARDPRELLDLLLDLLEESRRAVEGAVASALFEQAAGFPAGRVETATLSRAFDLERLRVILRWDVGDLDDWVRRARVRWLSSWRDGYALPRLVEELTLHPDRDADADRVVSTLAALFGSEQHLAAALDGQPLDWRRFDDLVVLDGLGDLFALAPPGGRASPREPVMPWQESATRHLTAPAPWALLDDVRLALEESAWPGTWAEAWQENLAGRRAAHHEARRRLCKELVEGWEQRLQEVLAARLDEVLAVAEPQDLGLRGGLRFRRGRLDRVEERAAYILRDLGSRRRTLDRDPSYDIVYLLTRYPRRYPGFQAQEARHRERESLTGDAQPLAEALIGTVSRAGVRAIQRQRADERRLSQLRQIPERTMLEEDELAGLIESVLLPEEANGVSGIEGFFDLELRGRNGYREWLGLGDYAESRTVKSVDGLDVHLTLQAGLQRAAERVINHPTVPYHDAKHDPQWYRRPAGAIVLLTPAGDVLAAASAPLQPGSDPPVFERTLLRPSFTPPGSVFKPFVAAWALEHLGLDPDYQVDCTVMEGDGRCGYVDVRCWKSYGHGLVDLDHALHGSCNAYFAWLGERFETEDFRQLARAFGFGAATGVRSPPPGAEDLGNRGGLAETTSDYLFQRELSDSLRRRAGNGLSCVEATPMQVGRAMAGLATGRLPDLRLVARIGDRELPRRSHALELSADTLETVRRSMVKVTQSAEGTAKQALNRDALGFVLAAKTGSADILGRASRDDGGRVRKHTWVSGWAPVNEPAFVVVVFVHDTSATSSHGAVYVAREFLTQPEVRGFLAQRGMDLEPPR